MCYLYDFKKIRRIINKNLFSFLCLVLTLDWSLSLECSTFPI